MPKASNYIPALSYDWLTPLYDRLLPLIMPERELKRRLIEQAHVASGHQVLDLGAGTATLTIMIKQAQPQAELVGLDGDLRVLKIGRAKAAAAGVALRLDHGLATHLPYEDASFDHVFSSLMFHHLTSQDKLRALVEVWRVLRPGGELHMLDLGRPHNVPAYAISLVMRHFEQTTDNIRGLLPAIMREAGFAQAAQTERRMTVFGTLSLYRGRKD
jgi:ubiquinone/menaquinone biosynthesis C-methylase UbiE